jgi:hypothetical protein
VRASVLASFLAACIVPGSTPTVPSTVSSTTPGTGVTGTGATTTPVVTSTVPLPVCDHPDAIVAGASSEPGPVTCPYGVDAVAVATCAYGGWAALVGGTGYATLGEAFAASAAGGTITACPGVHDEVDLLLDGGRALVAADPSPNATELVQEMEVTDASVRGGSPRDLAVAGEVTLECLTGPGGNTAVTAAADATLTVRWSTFHGYDHAALNMEFRSLGAVVVEDSEFSGNSNGEDGGAILVDKGSLTVRRSSFIGNASYSSNWGNGGAIAVHGRLSPGEPPTDSTPILVIEDSLFESNVTADPAVDFPSEHGEGGAVYAEGLASVTISGSTFRGNYVGANGGSAIVAGDALHVSNSTFSANQDRRDSLVIYASGSEGVLSAYGSGLTIEHTVFEDNTSLLGGAVLTANSGYASGPVTITASDLVVRRNVGADGALSLTGDVSFTCTCCDFGTGVDTNLPADALVDGVSTADLPIDFEL